MMTEKVKAGMKEKIATFIIKYGYNLKAFIICAIVFPPAALIIGLKHPTWTKAQKIITLTVLAVFVVIVVTLGSALMAEAYKLISLILGR